MTNYRLNQNSVISFFANQIIVRIVNNCIKEFQKWKITLSGTDSGLKNTWDEICVQIQGEYSFHWDTYEGAVKITLSRKSES
jgi:hypothetical protein